MPDVLAILFPSSGFMPHGHCYLWKPTLVWLQVVSNALIALSYLAISFTLAYLIYRIRDIPFYGMYLAFGLFIFGCALTHFMDVWTIWIPAYWTDGVIRVITAIASAGTAILLPQLVPHAVGLAQGAKVAVSRGMKLETVNRELNELFEKAKEMDRLKTRFFANVSHELRTPLTLILGLTQKMRSFPNLTEEQDRDLEVVTRNAHTLLKHVNDLLDVSKLEAGKLTPNYQEVDLVKWLRLTCSHFDGVARDRGISFSVDTPNLLMAQIDPDMFQRIIINLLSNAFKFVPMKGRIRVVLQQKSDKALLSVQDNGPGVPLQMREAIFERFRQVDEGETRRFGGTGLGLSIAKEFTDLHHGKIQVTDADGGGALFTLELPLRAPHGAVVQPSTSPVNVSREWAIHATENLKKVVHHLGGLAVSGDLEKGRVLVVEDNVDMNRFITEILSQDYEVMTAFDGREALEKVVSTHPDLVISDIMMPLMSGDQLITEIRKRPELNILPIILLTAKADDELRIKLLKEGAQDYVVKPFAAEEVLARVGNLVTIKRAREALQRELSSQIKDLQALTKEVTIRRKHLQQTIKKLKVAKEEAQRASQVKSNFLKLISHEMRTPMTGLQLQLEMLKRVDAEKLTPRQVDVVNRLSDSAQRGVMLIDSLLEFIKFQSSPIKFKTEVVDLPSLAAELVDSFQGAAQDKGLELKMLKTSVPVPPFVGDRVLVQIVIRNLIGNAIQYTDQGSVQVSIDFVEARHLHRIAVKDTGPGIPIDQRARIFEPFETLEPLAKRSKPGFGLGLAIAREIITVLGGKIELISEPGKGSTFVAEFPSAGRSMSSLENTAKKSA